MKIIGLKFLKENSGAFDVIISTIVIVIIVYAILTLLNAWEFLNENSCICYYKLSHPLDDFFQRN